MPNSTTDSPLPASLISARERANAAWEAFEEAINTRLRHTSNDWLGTVQWLNIKRATFAAQDCFQAELDKWKANNGME